MKRLLRHWKAFDAWTLGLRAKDYSKEQCDFLIHWIDLERATVCNIFFIVGIVFDGLSWWYGLEGDVAVPWVIANRCLFAIPLWLTGLFLAKSSWLKQWIVTIGSLFSAITVAFILHRVVSLGVQKNGDMTQIMHGAALCGVSGVVLLMAMIHRGALIVCLCAYIGGMWWALGSVSAQLLSFFVSMICVGALTNHIIHLFLLRQGMLEMKLRLSAYTRRTALSFEAKATAPSTKYCVCLSSDWREYQELVAGMADDVVAKMLENYYTRVEEVLDRELSNIDYYMDWIADELFVVMYFENIVLPDLAQRQQLTLQALHLARELLLAKEKFATDSAIELCIDIGLSVGKSLIGVLGPEHMRKSTALGSTPGRSRRMQQLGKFLRSQLGAEDRVIFGDELMIAAYLPVVPDISVQHFDVGERKMRNMEDKRIYFITATDHVIPGTSSEQEVAS